jgi:acyl carrier protein
MLEKLQEIMYAEFDTVGVELTSNFKKDFGLNSLDLFTLVCAVEEEFGVVVDPEHYITLNTTEDIINYIEAELKNRPETPTNGFGK